MSVRFHHWRLGFRQSSFHHIARVLQGTTLHAFRWPLLLRHALVPSSFRLQVNRMTQKLPFELLLTASGIQHRVPRRTLSPHTAHERRDIYGKFLFRQLQGIHPSQLAHSLTTSVPLPDLLPKGLRHVRGFPALRLLCPI